MDISVSQDNVLVRELFSTFIMKGLELHLLVPFCKGNITDPYFQESIIHTFDMQIMHLFKRKNLGFNLYML